MAFTPVVALADLSDGDMIGALVDRRRVLVLRFGGTVHAYEDRCAHQGVPLSGGRLDGYVLTCPVHEWLYDVRSGQGISPALACLNRFPVKIEHDQILVDVGPPGP